MSYIAVPFNRRFLLTVDNRRVTLLTRPNTGAKIFSLNLNDYSWIAADASLTTVITLSDHIETGGQLARHTVINKDTSQLLGFIERSQYTIIDIFLEIESKELLEANFDDLTKWSNATIARFVDIYRLESNERDVIEHRYVTYPWIVASICENYQYSDAHLHGAFTVFKCPQLFDDTLTRGYSKKPISDDVFLKIRARLQDNANIQLYEKLFLDSTEQSFPHGNHDLAIIVAETAFESYVQTLLIKQCEAHKLTQLPIAANPGVRESAEAGRYEDNRPG